MADSVNIFISYGRADGRDLAIRLRDDLLAVGCKVWLDLDEIPGGASWSLKIEEAIEHCHVTLALMTQASYESQWCRAEQLRSLRKGKRVIPLLLQEDAEIPLTLEHLNYLNFTDLSRYDAMFRDLMSDITAGRAFQAQTTKPSDTTTSPYTSRQKGGQKTYLDEKRNAPAFRRHLAKLRTEDWLGARYWWSYFLFHFTEIHEVVDILKADELVSAVEAGKDFQTRWDKFVRLYFRPRTPDLFRNEGFRPQANILDADYCPIPVYLLFDMEAIVCHPESRFSDGNPEAVKKTFKTPTFFNELPFDQIYHDSWFMPDEREEIMRCREAQVVIPDSIGLESLQLIWVRSHAEYETLKYLLPDDIWRQWRDKITPRRDYHLFNRKWTYMEEVALSESQIQMRFNPCEKARDCQPFTLSATIESTDGQQFQWSQADLQLDRAIQIDLPKPLSDGYIVTVQLDGDLAYANRYIPDDGLL